MLESLPMKDLIEHIRTVHFTLLVVVLIMIAALQIQRKRPSEKAASDAELIRHLSERWSETAVAVISDLDRTALTDPPRTGSVSSSEIVLPAYGQYSVDYGTDQSTSFPVTARWLYLKRDNDAFTSATIDQWKTLREFFSFWDRVQSGTDVLVPLVLRSGNNIEQCRNVHQDRAFGSMGDPSSMPLNHTIRWGHGSSWTVVTSVFGPSMSGFQPPLCSFAPADVRAYSPDLGHAFATVVAGTTQWGKGSSKQEFSELISAAGNLQDSPIRDVAEVLKERSVDDSATIELFQAKLPASAIPVYGSALLICIQFYLLSHLRELHRIWSLSRSGDYVVTGYLGLYKQPLSIVFTAMSLILLPMLPLGMIAFQAKSFVRVAALLTAVISVVLGTCCAHTLKQLRRFS